MVIKEKEFRIFIDAYFWKSMKIFWNRRIKHCNDNSALGCSSYGMLLLDLLDHKMVTWYIASQNTHMKMI